MPKEYPYLSIVQSWLKFVVRFDLRRSKIRYDPIYALVGRPVVNFIHILRAVFEPISFAKKLQSQTVLREKPSKTLQYEKGSSKMLMKLTPILLCTFQSTECIMDSDQTY